MIKQSLTGLLRIKMDTSTHTLQTLFIQLGLADDEEHIHKYIALHSPVPSNIKLAKAHFWNSAQSAFLSDAIKDDSDWCESVDMLDSLFREK